MKNWSFRQHINLQIILMLSGYAIAILSIYLCKAVTWFVSIGLALWVVAIVLRLHFIKCPHCGDKLLLCRVIPKYCPICGKELE